MKIKYLLYNSPRNLIAIIILVRNWYTALLYKTHLCGNINIYFRDGDVVDTQIPFHINWDTLRRIILLKYYLVSFNLHKDGDEIVFIVNNDIKLIVDNYSINDTLALVEEQFRDDYYRVEKRSFDQKTVVDIGGNIGDSAILFAKKGAIVYSFEPISFAFNRMLKNVSINNVSDRVHMFQVALSDHDEEREIRFNPYALGGFSLDDTKNDVSMIQDKISIVEVIGYLKKQNIFACDLLKIDCEGCEIQLLNDSRLLDFLKPEELMVEYHCGNYTTIMMTIRNKYQDVERVQFEHAPDYGIIYAKMPINY